LIHISMDVDIDANSPRKGRNILARGVSPWWAADTSTIKP
jgi:hypothetical protein